VPFSRAKQLKKVGSWSLNFRDITSVPSSTVKERVYENCYLFTDVSVHILLSFKGQAVPRKMLVGY